MFRNQQVDLHTLPMLASVVLKPISKNYFKIIILNKVIIYGVVTCLLIAAKFKIEEEVFQDNFDYIVVVAIIFFLLNFIVGLLSF